MAAIAVGPLQDEKTSRARAFVDYVVQRHTSFECVRQNFAEILLASAISVSTDDVRGLLHKRLDLTKKPEDCICRAATNPAQELRINPNLAALALRRNEDLTCIIHAVARMLDTGGVGSVEVWKLREALSGIITDSRFYQVIDPKYNRSFHKWFHPHRWKNTEVVRTKNLDSYFNSYRIWNPKREAWDYWDYEKALRSYGRREDGIRGRAPFSELSWQVSSFHELSRLVEREFGVEDAKRYFGQYHTETRLRRSFRELQRLYYRSPASIVAVAGERLAKRDKIVPFDKGILDSEKKRGALLFAVAVEEGKIRSQEWNRLCTGVAPSTQREYLKMGVVSVKRQSAEILARPEDLPGLWACANFKIGGVYEKNSHYFKKMPNIHETTFAKVRASVWQRKVNRQRLNHKRHTRRLEVLSRAPSHSGKGAAKTTVDRPKSDSLNRRLGRVYFPGGKRQIRGTKELGTQYYSRTEEGYWTTEVPMYGGKKGFYHHNRRFVPLPKVIGRTPTQYPSRYIGGNETSPSSLPEEDISLSY